MYDEQYMSYKIRFILPNKYHKASGILGKVTILLQNYCLTLCTTKTYNVRRNVMANSNPNDTDSRLTIRIDPEYGDALDNLAKELGLNKSIVIRKAIQEYVERQERYLSPPLFRFFLKWRQNRNRYGMM
jgi:hypothetical protein